MKFTIVDEYGRSLCAEDTHGRDPYLFVHWCRYCKNSVFLIVDEEQKCDCGNVRELAKTKTLPDSARKRFLQPQEIAFNCKHCGNVFVSKTTNRRYCSRRCAAVASWRNSQNQNTPR